MSCHSHPIKRKPQGKNHRKTKIPFPFPARDLQSLKTALHYQRRGWGYSSLYGRACAWIDRRQSERFKNGPLSMFFCSCCASGNASHRRLYRTAVISSGFINPDSEESQGKGGRASRPLIHTNQINSLPLNRISTTMLTAQAVHPKTLRMASR